MELQWLVFYVFFVAFVWVAFRRMRRQGIRDRSTDAAAAAEEDERDAAVRAGAGVGEGSSPPLKLARSGRGGRCDGATASVGPNWEMTRGASGSSLGGRRDEERPTRLEAAETLDAGAVDVARSPVLGEGGAAFVCRGSFHGGAVAIKSPRRRGSRELRDLRREADLHAGLRHPHVLQVYGFCGGEAPGLVLELGDQSLFDLLHDASGEPNADWARAPVAAALTVARDLSSALVFLHSRRVAHRDVKSDNVLLVNGAVKLCDFGLAAGPFPVPRDGDGDLRPVGTLAWMAPELHARATPATTPVGDDHRLPPPPPGTPTKRRSPLDGDAWFRSDVYSFGVVLFEIITGDSPWRGHDAKDIRDALARGERPAAPKLHKSPVLDTTCRVCLRPAEFRPKKLEPDVVANFDVFIEWHRRDRLPQAAQPASP